MEFFLLVLVVGLMGFWFASSILAWANYKGIRNLKKKIQTLEQSLSSLKPGAQNLQKQVSDLKDSLSSLKSGQEKHLETPPFSDQQNFPPPLPSQPHSEPVPAISHASSAPEAQPAIAQSSSFPQPKTLHSPRSRQQPQAAPKKPGLHTRSDFFERNLGMKIPIWLGSIALALGGIFLVKYSIDQNLLSPSVRVFVGGIFGILLLAGSQLLYKFSTIPNNHKIAQALSGAGLVVLYASVFVATSFYELLSPYQGFFGMAVITGTAVMLSLQQGRMVAALGFIGGFLSPVLAGFHDLTPLTTMASIFLLFAGSMGICAKQGWWKLSSLILTGAGVWAAIWLVTYSHEDLSPWLSLFILACLTVLGFGVRYGKTFENKESKKNSILGPWPDSLIFISIPVSFLLFGFVLHQTNFGNFEWACSGILVIASMLLAYKEIKLYAVFPIIGALVSAFLFASWQENSYHILGITIALFTLPLLLFSYVLSFKAKEYHIYWQLLYGGISLLFFFIAYFKLDALSSPIDIPFFWGFLSGFLTLPHASLFYKVYKKEKLESVESQQRLTTACTFFIIFLFIALTIELQKEFLSPSVALGALVLAIMQKHFRIKALRFISGALLLFFFGLAFYQFIPFLEVFSSHPLLSQLPTSTLPAIIRWPVFQLGLPAAFFIATSIYLKCEEKDLVRQSFEISSALLITTMGYLLIRHGFHDLDSILYQRARFLERTIHTNLFLLSGFIAASLGAFLSRKSLVSVGIGLCALAFFRVFFFDLLVYNPLWNRQNVGDLPILNILLPAYALPAAWLSAYIRHPWKSAPKHLMSVAKAMTLFLSFVFISFQVRHYYQGAFLNGFDMTNAEMYAYSVTWIFFGFILLILGLWKESTSLRLASLLVMVLAVGKVFIFDAAELEGLYRVASFLGLGLSLLALSYLYDRFVFKRTNLDAQKQ